MNDPARRTFFARLLGRRPPASAPEGAPIASEIPKADSDVQPPPGIAVPPSDQIASEWQSAETHEDKRAVLSTYGIAAVALALVALPQQADAFSASGLARETVRQLEPVIREIMEVFGVGLFSAISQAGDGTSTAVGISGDAMVNAIVSSHNENVRLASRPDSNRCVSDASAETNTSVARNAARQKAALADQGVKELMHANEPLQRLVREAESRERVYGDNSNDLNSSLLIKPAGYTADEEAAAAALRNRLRASAVIGAASAAGIAPGAEPSPTDRLNQLAKAEYVAKSGVADFVMASCIADRKRDKRARQIIDRAIAEDTDPTQHLEQWIRDNDPQGQGLSARDLLQFEVERRYGNPDWHTVIRTEMVNPAPLLRELVLMEAVGLRVKLKQLELLEQQAVVGALQLSEMLKAEAETLANIQRGNT